MTASNFETITGDHWRRAIVNAREHRRHRRQAVRAYTRRLTEIQQLSSAGAQPGTSSGRPFEAGRKTAEDYFDSSHDDE